MAQRCALGMEDPVLGSESAFVQTARSLFAKGGDACMSGLSGLFLFIKGCEHQKADRSRSNDRGTTSRDVKKGYRR